MKLAPLPCRRSSRQGTDDYAVTVLWIVGWVVLGLALLHRGLL
jgi:hypothetical protein